MGKFICFILGIVTGVVLTIGGVVVLGAMAQAEETSGVTMFDQPGEEMTARKYEVIQVIPIGALARSEEISYGQSMFTGPVVLFYTEGQSAHYDDEVIKVPKGKRVVQVGTYQYNSAVGNRTVPIVRIME